MSRAQTRLYIKLKSNSLGRDEALKIALDGEPPLPPPRFPLANASQPILSIVPKIRTTPPRVGTNIRKLYDFLIKNQGQPITLRATDFGFLSRDAMRLALKQIKREFRIDIEIPREKAGPKPNPNSGRSLRKLKGKTPRVYPRRFSPRPPDWVIKRIDEFLAYDREHDMLYWKKALPGVKRGHPAGSRNKVHHYVFVRFHNIASSEIVVSLVAGYVIWYLCTGEWPTSRLDYVDGDTMNNNIENLKLT